MRPDLTLTLLAFFLISQRAGSPVSGHVSHRISGCDYFLVQTRSGYDLLEWYGGHDPDKDDVLVGASALRLQPL